MCLGSPNKASKEAAAAEEKRKADIAAAQKRIEGIFGSAQREGEIRDLEAATRDFLQEDLTKKNIDASRGLKFALARSGLSKGSVDADTNKRLADDYLKGIIEVERRSKTAGLSLRAQDNETKNALFSQILGGLDATTAAQQASSALRQNVGLAKSDALQSGLGDLFGDFGDIFKFSQEAAGDRRAAFDFNTLYGQRQTPTASVAGSSVFS
jgi:hypothetical protein